MVLLKRVSLVFAALIVAAGIGWILIGPEWRALLAHQPYGRDVLFWNQAQRDAGFRMIDRIPFVIESHAIAHGDTARDLPEGEPLDQFFRRQIPHLHAGRRCRERRGHPQHRRSGVGLYR